MKALLLGIVAVCSSTLSAQLPSPSAGIAGKFHVSVDDTARIYLNGELIHEAPVGASASKEVTIRNGDRIVAQLHNLVGPRRFKLAFVSTDGRSAIFFQRQNYKIIPDLTRSDFSMVDWVKWTKQPKQETKGQEDRLPFKNTAEWTWGDGDICSIGVLIASNMFRASVAPAGAAVAQVKHDFPLVLTVEGHIDGPSTLYVRRDGIMWINGQNAKPGYGREPTYVNGKEWLPKWGAPTHERGVDRSDVHPITLETLDLKAELTSNSAERGVDAIDASRSSVQIKRRSDAFEILIPDPEPGARWYKFEFRARKK